MADPVAGSVVRKHDHISVLVLFDTTAVAFVCESPGIPGLGVPLSSCSGNAVHGPSGAEEAEFWEQGWNLAASPEALGPQAASRGTGDEGRLRAPVSRLEQGFCPCPLEDTVTVLLPDLRSTEDSGRHRTGAQSVFSMVPAWHQGAAAATVWGCPWGAPFSLRHPSVQRWP